MDKQRQIVAKKYGTEKIQLSANEKKPHILVPLTNGGINVVNRIERQKNNNTKRRTGLTELIKQRKNTNPLSQREILRARKRGYVAIPETIHENNTRNNM